MAAVGRDSGQHWAVRRFPFIITAAEPKATCFLTESKKSIFEQQKGGASPLLLTTAVEYGGQVCAQESFLRKTQDTAMVPKPKAIMTIPAEK